jgi:predicted amidophosphoribosyltransferase
MGLDRPTATIVRVRKPFIHFLCTNCQGAVDASDPYCRHCGARLLGVKT